MNQDLKTETLALLEQFGQVILSGPPGTGKTRLALHVAAASILEDPDAESLPIGKDSQFALVQFHPSYNYEDFVRGIQVKTDDNNNVVYETVDRVFGEMAKRAAASDDPHILVIDEINRANVSAVLGELIYSLEYRGKEVQTPYKIGGETRLVIPKNLQIIGTMNTADRTIGQIDYAVRRRFAFVHCPPQRSVLKNETAETFFDLVDSVFAHLSADHNKEDVCIGHSYFLADSESKLARKIIYQIVPILREYLKDGILKKEAKAEIDAIEEEARKLGKSDKQGEGVTVLQNKGQRSEWRWTHTKSATSSEWLPLNRMVLSLVEDYVRRNSVADLAQLQQAFPKECAFRTSVVEDKDALLIPHDRFFMRNPIQLGDGKFAIVSNQWAWTGPTAKKIFPRFKRRVGELGYEISRHSAYAFVNVGEGDHRNWDDCRKYGFLAAGGFDTAGKPWFANQLKTLRVGEKVFASIGRAESVYKGFVGYGEVVEEAQRIEDFRWRDGKDAEKPLLECDLKAPNPNGYKDEGGEWLVRVKWIKTLNREDAVEGTGNRNVVWRVTDAETRRNLESGFGILDADE